MPEDFLQDVDSYCIIHGYEDMLVTVSTNDGLFTLVLEFDAVDLRWIWSWDWYEGQKNVELLGFVPLSHLKIIGMEVHYIE